MKTTTFAELRQKMVNQPVKPVNNPGSSHKLSGLIFDLSKKEFTKEQEDTLAKLMIEELGSDLAAPIKQVDLV